MTIKRQRFLQMILKDHRFIVLTTNKYYDYLLIKTLHDIYGFRLVENSSSIYFLFSVAKKRLK